MKQSSSVALGDGMNFSSVLLLIFIVLKLTHVIHWSWWWVLSPLWIGFSVTLLVFIIATVIVAVLQILR